jgi:peptide/nickel transport system permease protein
MTGYLVRRIVQMFLVVIVATMVLYVLLNVAPGGPLSGLQNATADRRQRVSEADINRLTAYLGLDKPLALRYVVWMIGEDWLGADWMSLSLSLGGYQLDPEVSTVQAVDPHNRVRFWADPGVAHLGPGYELWVRGEEADGVLEASYVEAKPTGTPPDDVYKLRVIEVQGPNMRTEYAGGQEVLVKTTEETEFVIPGAEPRPEDGSWVDVGWLTNPYRGILSDWAGFHGNGHGVVRLDWGVSWKMAVGQPVVMLFASRLGNTLLLMSLASIISLTVAIPIGVLSAVKQYSLLDYFVTTFSFFGASMPVFWFGLMVILLFSFKFHDWGLPYMPAGGVVMVRPAAQGQVLSYLNATPGGVLDRAIHLVMPAMVLSLFSMATWSRFTRTSMLEVLRQDYVRTARSKGLRERIVIGKHALRNALIPVITIVVFQIPGLFGGAIITETVFAYSGIGRLYFTALSVDDWPIVMIYLLISTFLVVLATLIGDILYTVVDPRIRLD